MAHRVPPRICVVCGADFWSSGESVTCSANCRAIHKARRAGRRTIPCEICGSQFAPCGKPRRTCSRKCGEVLRRTVTGTMPPERVSAEWPSCRIWVRECDQCGELFTARRALAMTCSSKCRRRRHIRIVSESITRRYWSDPDFRAQLLTKGHNRRASKLGAGSITSPADLIAYLMWRDRGRCRVEDCLFADRRIRAKAGPGKPSIDHIVPLSLGGEHSLENIQLAHYRCNLSKNNRIRAVQPLLVG